MPKIQFFLLDITYKIIDNKPVIYLFGRTVKGKSICVTDDNFNPYFWVIPRSNADIKKRLEKLKVESAEVTGLEIINKKYLGKKIEAIKVYTKQPKDIPVIRNNIKEWEEISLISEYDIPFVKRYLIDKKIIPLTLIEAEGDFVTSRFRVTMFKANKISNFSEDTINDPKILAFDIETYNPEGKNIFPEKNPIIMLSFYGERVVMGENQSETTEPFRKVITWKKFKTNKDYIEFVDGEAELINKFKEVVDTYKPDILTGYFSDEFDLPYISTRAAKYKIKLDLGIDNSELKISKGRNSTKSSITGIIHLDIFKFILRVMGDSLDTEVYDLSSIANELLNEKKLEIDLENLVEVWDNRQEELERYCDYNLHDSKLAFRLCKDMLPNLIELVKIVGITLYDVSRLGFSLLVEWYLIRQALNFNEISPNKPSYDEIKSRRMYSYKGAFVFEPQPGFYENIVVFDYKSLYPTIISSHNISPGTLRCECCKEEAEITPTEDSKEKYWFCKKKKGFIPIIIEELITRRLRIKEIIKDKHDIWLEARQNSLKLLANSFYGYLGFFGARWYSIESAKSVTAWGRYYIYKVIDRAKKENFNVIYSDTDSVFISLEKRTKKDAENFMESINLELPEIMELEFEGFYPAGIFVSAKIALSGAKKKYALLSDKGLIKIKGFETVRRNWSIIAKETQEKVLSLILKEKSPEKAVNFVRDVISKLRRKELPLSKVIIHTQMQKDVTSYDSIGPHVAVARRMEKKGQRIEAGTLISFIVIQGNEKIRDRARLPEEVRNKEYDADYYINNQIIPSVERILNIFGYKKEDLLEEKEQKKLESFFK
jgi:DNA polymerase I